MLKSKIGKSFVFLTLAILSHGFSVEACTGIKLKAKDGSFVHGRTLEFGVKVDLSLVFVPRKHVFVGTTANGPGLRYETKYASIGAITTGHLALLDGVNEKGLAVGTFYFPTFAGYAELTNENQSKALSPVEFPNWVLTQFESVEDLKSALSKVVIVPTVSQEWGKAPPPFHYIVYDKQGACLVIEPIAGKLITYDNPLGALTNSPTFDWHMTNLRNFIHLATFNAKPITFDGVVFNPLGQGSGMVGLPGDFTPPSRFVRAVIFSSTAEPSENAHEAVFQCFHILNQFDIPLGVAKERDDGVVHSDYTLMTCVRDPQSLKYYMKSYENQAIQYADLSKFDFDAKSVKKLRVGGENVAQDISSELKNK